MKSRGYSSSQVQIKDFDSLRVLMTNRHHFQLSKYSLGCTQRTSRELKVAQSSCQHFLRHRF